MAIIIGSQLDVSDNAALRALPSHPIVLEAPQEAPWRLAQESDVLLVRPTLPWRAAGAVPPQWPGRVRWIFSVTSGMDPYPDWIYRVPAVTCGRGLADDEIADYVIAAIYRQAKDLDGATAKSPDDWTPRALGRVLGSTVGLIGFGAIARAVARRALALGADVVAVRNDSSRPSEIPAVRILPDVAAVAAVSDHLLVAVPAIDATRSLIDAAALRHVKPGAHLINIARGSIIDQEALIDALDDGRLGFATLDVTDPEPLPGGHRLWTHPKVRLTPHLANNAIAGRPKLIAKFASDLDRLLRGEMPTDLVDPLLGY